MTPLEAQNLGTKLSNLVTETDLQAFLIIIPFEMDDGGYSYLNATESTHPILGTLLVDGTMKTALQFLMEKNFLSLSAAAGALHAMLDDATEELREELLERKETTDIDEA